MRTNFAGFKLAVLTSNLLCSVTFAAGQKSVPVKEEMDGLYSTMSELLPLVVSKASFESPKNRQKIASHMNRLAELTKKMSANSKRFADNDPSIEYLSERFSEDVRYAIEMWNTGDREIPRRLLKGTTDYCISCHTRTNKGPHFHDLIQPKGFKSMPAVSKAEYFAATRQFDDALKQYEHVLVDRPLAKIDPQAWDLSVRKMLAITVRVKKDPSLTVEMISRLQDKPDALVDSIRVNLPEWRKAAKEWSAEGNLVAKTDEQLLVQAKKLTDEAKELESKVSGGALIQFLRASSLYHEVLGKTSKSKQSQETLFLAGEAARYLSDVNLWTMHDIYFEQCIRQGQDKVIGKKCYLALEASNIKSYGAASKSGLPEFVRVHLDQLAKIVN